MKYFVFVLFLFVVATKANSLEISNNKTPDYKEIQKNYFENIKKFAETKKIPENVIPEDYLKKMNSGEFFEVKSKKNSVLENEENKSFFDLLE